ncbi:MAG: glutamine--scyllo-inositol aminotransferase [Deltaproteobacteria bacterium]|nr:MAG: glutamine--scyllo-inositol aminotransferase [Deltaproteobacteria bacterium]PIE74693.1 MAG: glutamine--scyllo-inositol aminotransferase [Deltaproteobacteria bacterium]
MIKLCKPNISEDVILKVSEVLRSGQLVHGKENEAFEKELADYLGCSDVVTVSSGTAALHLSVMALNIGTGDAVIVPDFTFPATANAVIMNGARVVIAEVNPYTYNISIESVEDIIKNWKYPETLKALIPVHEFGCPAEMGKILELAEKYNLKIIEDAACALGALYKNKKVGTIGDCGCFSFHPRKNLTTGEGGAVSTNNSVLADRIRNIKNHGINFKSGSINFVEPGINYRMTNFQAAMGRCQLPFLDEWILKRKNLITYYYSKLNSLVEESFLYTPENFYGHSWQTFMVVLSDKFERNSIISSLKKFGIETNLGAQSLSSLNIYGELKKFETGYRLFSQGLALPLYESLKLDDIDYILKILKKILKENFKNDR